MLLDFAELCSKVCYGWQVGRNWTRVKIHVIATFYFILSPKAHVWQSTLSIPKKSTLNLLGTTTPKSRSLAECNRVTPACWFLQLSAYNYLGILLTNKSRTTVVWPSPHQFMSTVLNCSTCMDEFQLLMSKSVFGSGLIGSVNQRGRKSPGIRSFRTSRTIKPTKLSSSRSNNVNSGLLYTSTT